MPLFRPLMLNYQDDANTYNLDDEFMVGPDLLAAPILKPGATRRLVYLPKGIWFDFWTKEKYEGGTMIAVEAPLEVVPLFVRGGAVLPVGPEMNWVGEKPSTPLTFEIFPDERGEAALSLYEDDGASPAYTEGVFRRTPVRVSKTADGFDIEVGASEGTYRTPARDLAFELPDARQKARVPDTGTAQRLHITEPPDREGAVSGLIVTASSM